MALQIAKKAFDPENLPTIIRNRETRTSKYAGLFDSMEPGDALPIPENDAEWKNVKINGEVQRRHPAYAAAMVWAKAHEGAKFATRTVDGEFNIIMKSAPNAKLVAKGKVKA